MKLAPLLAALSLGTLCAYGQGRLLELSGLRDKAWGAWMAGASHDPAMREPLLAQLQIAQSMRGSQPDTEEYAYIQALFDALIQIPGPIPTDIILPFEDSWRTEILILLSRDPAAEGAENALLDMREHAMPAPQWTAVNDLLFAVSSKRFFQKTLEEIRVTHEFVVIDPHEGVAFCGGALGCGGSRRHFPKGFPPIALTSYGPRSRIPAILFSWSCRLQSTTAGSWRLVAAPETTRINCSMLGPLSTGAMLPKPRPKWKTTWPPSPHPFRNSSRTLRSAIWCKPPGCASP